MFFAFVQVKNWKTFNLTHCFGDFDRFGARGELLENLAIEGEVNPVVEVGMAFDSNHG